jgi:hypothetical protein
MKAGCPYRVSREISGSYRLDRVSPPTPGPCARIVCVSDRTGVVLGWKLRSLVTMQGSQSRLWPSVADALTATKLMTPGQANAAVIAADAERSP